MGKGHGERAAGYDGGKAANDASGQRSETGTGPEFVEL